MISKILDVVIFILALMVFILMIAGCSHREHDGYTEVDYVEEDRIKTNRE